MSGGKEKGVEEGANKTVGVVVRSSRILFLRVSIFSEVEGEVIC